MDQQASASAPSAKETPTAAVSIFGQAGGSADQFPVLKAFQEYIDAEQAKARKRMIELSVFFVVLMVVVVVTFIVVLSSSINRNQALSDKLLDLALRERQQSAPVVQQALPVAQPAIVAPPPAPATDTAAMKQIAAELAALKESVAAARQQPAAPATAPTEDTEDAAARKLRQRLEKQEEELRVSRAKAREAEERIHKMEVEKQRRRLYPEYYAQHPEETEGDVNPPSRAPGTARPARKPDAAAAQPLHEPAQAAAAQPAADDDAEIANLKPHVYFTEEDEAPAPKPVLKPAAPAIVAPVPKAPAAKPAAAPSSGAGDYVVPLESKRQGTVPWRVALPD